MPEEEDDDEVEAEGGHFVTAAMDYTPVADGELGFSEGDRILVQNKDPSGWWCGKRVQSGEVGWFSPEFVQEEDEGLVLPLPEPEPQKSSYSIATAATTAATTTTTTTTTTTDTQSDLKPCTTCHCRAFAPNPFRPKSCRDCWHNISFHE
eukprot:TRINITY_DN1233_c0_g1_i1.p1 TRINITY_DN1233_c0_g1~~TRINITY_DN1233_c0_g1_i1.p1  ORF type:complete len:158 (-),score=39.17 TRINITY_DN1233_c0_g1_i1:164-613(-)